MKLVQSVQENEMCMVTESVESVERSIIGKVSESLEIVKSKRPHFYIGVRKVRAWIMKVQQNRDLARSLNIDPVRHIEEMPRMGHAASRKIMPIRIKFKTAERKAEILKRVKLLSWIV